jgi:hypothetical protein
MAVLDDEEDLVLEAEIAAPTGGGAAPDGPGTDAETEGPAGPGTPVADTAEAHGSDARRDGTLEPGDPPPSVRGVAQELVDPPGDAADDGVRRWDPRTVRAPQREGG